MMVRKNGGALHLANPSPRVENLLSTARLTAIFQIFRSEEEAVLSLADRPRGD
jgi:anti-anti-sigma regulatory factor